EFGNQDADFYEKVATADETTLDQYLELGKIEDSAVKKLINQRKIFPVYFGAALKLIGIDEFLAGLDKWTDGKKYTNDFGARIF
ncbi:tetracycline resistance protein TetP, partial [Limosilactobacillus reuteri]